MFSRRQEECGDEEASAGCRNRSRLTRFSIPSEIPRVTNPLALPDPWNYVADGYVQSTMQLLGLFAEPAIERAQLTPTTRVVDIAAGPGTVACRVAPHVNLVRAVDFSAAMVEHCRERARQLGLANLVVEVGDGQALPYADASFDVGFSMFGLMFFPDRLQGFRELHRVLVPSGRAFVTSWAPLDQSPLMSLMFAALRTADPSRPAPQRDATTLENRELFESEMLAAGFVDVHIEPVFRDVEFENLDSLIGTMFRGSAPIELLRRRLGEPEWLRQQAVMSDYLAEEITQFPVRLGSAAHLGYGKKPE